MASEAVQAVEAVEGASAQPKIILHWLERSRAHRILWLIEELNLECEIKVYKRSEEQRAPPELKAIHPLGKSPIVTVQPVGAEKPIVLAESAAIVEFLSEHFGKHLIPKHYVEGKEGQIDGETEEWLRYRYLMHFAEGSLGTVMTVGAIAGVIRKASVPFFIKPIIKGIVDKINSGYVQPNSSAQLELLENQLATSPNGGEFMCGKELTGADILLSFPLEATAEAGGLAKEKYPKLAAYVERLHGREAFQRAGEKIKKLTDKADPLK